MKGAALIHFFARKFLLVVSVQSWVVDTNRGLLTFARGVGVYFFFFNFEKMICSKGLKLSAAVYSSFPIVLICQLCVHQF